MAELLEGADGATAATLAPLLDIGLNHEQQHQELLLTDIKHVFSCHPLKPAVHPELQLPRASGSRKHEFIAGRAGIHEVGATGESFCFDNERPRHRVLLPEHAIGSRLITNGEYREFIHDGGYETSELWLSDGWAAVNERSWRRPLYWSEDLEREFIRTSQDAGDAPPMGQQTIGGKEVWTAVDERGATPIQIFVYADGDTLYFITGSLDHATEVLEALP